jgi:diguanylate cyclase (GGDEF)-like protein/PAS domain S-box-containing protein
VNAAMAGSGPGTPDKDLAGAHPLPRLLVLEDDPYDAELELRELKRHGLSFAAVSVVSNEAAFVAALEDFEPDVVLADYRLPGMTGETALDHVLTRRPEIPFVFVSGTLGEDHAVELMKRGAWDYVLKDRPSRLGPAVSRSLAEARERHRLEAERALALQRLQERTQQMQAIVDAVQDGLSFFETVRDSDGRIVDFVCAYANPIAASTLQRRPDEVIGHTLLEVLPSMRGGTTFRGFVEVVETGRPLGYVMGLDDGPVRGTFEGRAAKLGDGFVVVYRDVTDRHAAEQALRRSEARYRGLVLALGEGILVQDAAGVVVECNEAAERILGRPRASLIGHPYPATRRQMVREDGSPLPAAAHPTLTTLSTGHPCRDTVIGLRRRDGATRWVLTNAEPLVVPGSERDDDAGRPAREGVVTSYADITELRRAQHELRASEERFRLAFEEALTGMALIDVTDSPGRFLRVNRALSEFLGRGEEQLLKLDLAEVTRAEDLPELRSALDALVAGQLPRYRTEQQFTHESGKPLWAVLSISMVRDHSGSPLYALTAMEDITARKDAEDELAFKALHDDLTGLPNRALLLDHLHSALARALRAGTLVGVLFIDLDDFKSVNDSFGHAAGDDFLIQVSERISRSLRETDTAARIGGDEFVVVCENLAEAADATVVAQRIQSALGAGLPVHGRTVGAPASIGIAISGEDTSAEGLLRDADAAMYTAKRRGGRRWHPADTFMHTAAMQMLSLEEDLRDAIRLGQLRLHYQPTLDLQSRRMVGVEALLRWDHPSRGLLLPQELIEVAERRNLIGSIGTWVLETACAQAGAWVGRFGAQAPVVAVNISTRQLGDQELPRQVHRLLQQADLPPDKLCLEITESQFISVGSSATADLRQLSDSGIAIAVDDFGTGFAGFDYLRRLPVNTLKIDKSYVSGLGRDQTDSAIVASVVTLARSLGLLAIAEGIETADQYSALQRLGCPLGQGWLWHPALPAPEVERLIELGDCVNGSPAGGGDPDGAPPQVTRADAVHR